MVRGKISWIWTLMFILLIFQGVSIGDIIYVDDDAPGGSGQSWDTAYKYLQDALAVAEADAEVRVAQGTYRPDRDSANPNGTGDRKATFELLSGMILKGGYAGLGNVDPNAWDVSLYETVLSGDLAGNDVLVNDPCDLLNEPTRSENSANIIMIRHASGISLEGLTIRGGFANIGQRGAVPQTVQGGGAYIFDCTNLAIDQCRFINNYAAFDGGGVLIDLCENVQVNDCLFLKNASSSGGGLLIGRSKGRIFRSRIEGNYASQSGGGVYVVNSEAFLITCMLINNCSNSSGGGTIFSDSSGGLSSCVFKDNFAVGGGGMFIFGKENIEITDCSFLRNESKHGGAIHLYTQGVVRLSTNLFCGNNAITGGGILSENCRELIVSNCTGTANKALMGSFLSCEALWPWRKPSLGAISITSSIIEGEANTIFTEDATISINYTNLLGGTTSVIDPNNNVTWGIGNIDSDPLFADPGYWDDNGTPDDANDDVFVEGDYHLKSQGGHWDSTTQSWIVDDVTSPCIDAGDPNSPIGLEPFPNGGRVNMGAYGGTTEASKSYFGEPPCETIIAGDINGDCKVNFDDMKILIDHWLSHF